MLTSAGVGRRVISRSLSFLANFSPSSLVRSWTRDRHKLITSHTAAFSSSVNIWWAFPRLCQHSCQSNSCRLHTSCQSIKHLLSATSQQLRTFKQLWRYVHLCCIWYSDEGGPHHTVSNVTDDPCIKSQCTIQSDNKSSAVAEMGDRLATIDMGRKVGRPSWVPI